MNKDQFDLLTSRRFLPLFLTQFLGALNDNVFKNALVILITYVAAAKAGMEPQILVTLAAGIFILPFFILSATAGQLADKFEKSGLIRRIKLIEILLMIAASIGFYFNSVWLLMGVLFCMGAQSAFFGPLKYSILPDHLRENELIGGNALVEAGTFLAILLGTIAGGLLILAEGGVGIVSIMVISVAALGWLASRHIPQALPPAPELKVNWNIAGETWRIMGYARENADVFLSIIGISWFWLVGATFLAQFPTFAKVVLGADETVVTFFLTLFSIGIGIGSMLCNKLLKSEVSATFVPFGALGMAAFTVLLYFASRQLAPGTEMLDFAAFVASPSHWLIIAALLGVAVCGGIYIVPLYAIMQSRSNPQYRARIIAANNVMNALFMVVSAIATLGLFAAGLSVTDVFLAVGLVNLPIAWMIRWIVKHQQAKRKKGEENAA